MADFYERLQAIEARRQSTGQTPLSRLETTDRIWNAMQLDTFVGQAATSLKFHNEYGDHRDFDPVEGYNPADDDLLGYQDYYDEFITSRSPAETAVRKQIIDRNKESRRSLEDHGWARFFGNVIDPINLIPIPLAKGLGFINGAKRGAKVGLLGLGPAEAMRAQLDPTNPVEEPYLAIAGGALLGGAIGGIAGGIGAAKLDFMADNWFLSQNAVDAYNRLEEILPDSASTVRPFVERKTTVNKDGLEYQESFVDHVKRLIDKSSRESKAEYDARVLEIASDPKKYEDLVEVSKSWNPDAFIPTGTAIENMRFAQHPYFLLKNNLFQGELGNSIRRLADRITGSPGMLTRGMSAGDAIAQGVHNKSKLHNSLAVDAQKGMYHAYLKEQGIDPTTMGPLGRALKSVQTSLVHGREYREFKDDVMWMVTTGEKSTNANVVEAATALKTYMDAMGKAGQDAGIFGVARLNRRKKFLQEEVLPNSDRSVLNQVDRLRGALSDEENLLGRDWLVRAIDDLEGRKSLSKLQAENLERFRAELKEVDFVLMGDNRISLLEQPREAFKNKGVQIYHDRIKRQQEWADELADIETQLNSIKEASARGELPQAEKQAFTHWSRMFRHDVIVKHRAEFLKILEDWYIKTDTTGIRANQTLDSILKQRTQGDIKRLLDDAMRREGLPPSTIDSALAKIDAIFKKKSVDPKIKQGQLEEAHAVVRELVNLHGVGKDARLAEALKEVERMASRGEPEDFAFGAASATRERILEMPSYMLTKRYNGIADFIQTDPELMLRQYHRRMAASIEMGNEFGDATMKNFTDELKLRLESEVDNAVGKEAEALARESSRVIQAVTDMKEKVLGVYKLPTDPSSVSARSVRGIKNAMVLALMGKASVAALADMGRTVMSVGFSRAFKGAFDKFTVASEEFKIAGREVELAGEAAEVALHGRWEAFFDVDGAFGGNTMIERMLDTGVNKMFILNALSPYTDMMKRFSGALIQSEMIRTSVKWAGDLKWVDEGGEMVMRGKQGKLTKPERDALTKVGIDLDDAVKIADQWTRAGAQRGASGKGSLHLANTGAWDDPVIRNKFRVALVDEVNNAVITPGPAEKLNFMSTQVGSLMTQFKSFGFSATHRTLLAGLQQRDAKALHGILSMIAMGYMVDIIKSPSYDKRDFTSIDRLVQAIDYSGATGIMFDLDNMLEVMSGNTLGIRPMLGVDSFFKDPNLAQRTGQVGGPVASLGLDLANSILNPDADSQDMARSVRRLLPFNNLIWFSWAIDRLQRSAGSIGEDDDE